MTTIAQLAVGTVFGGDYRVLGLLRAGGMGAVYVVEQLSTSKQRALKLMHPQLVADASLRRRFEQEARVGARIESEHVVEVQAAGVDAASSMPWLVMELLRGEDLSAVMARRGALPPAEVREIFDQICHAVGAAHAAGIVHRDLKPENVFLAESRQANRSYIVKVLDFGIAKLVAEAGTHATSAMGSPIWMAPEQTETGQVTASADVWALGLMAFHLLTGMYLWKVTDGEATLPQLMRAVLFEPIPRASERAAQRGVADLLPPGFDDWLAQCVVRDPSARLRDAKVAFRALDNVLRGASDRPAITTGAQPARPISTSFEMPTHTPRAVTPPAQQAVVIQSGGAPPTSRTSFAVTEFASGAIGAAARGGQPPTAGSSTTGPVVHGMGTPPPASDDEPEADELEMKLMTNALHLPKRGSGGKGKLVAVAGGMLVLMAGAAVVVVVATRGDSSGTVAAPSGASSATISNAEKLLLGEAKWQCSEGDCEAAHDKINKGIPLWSPARQSPEFIEIENHWADDLLQRAAREPDKTKRRDMYSRIVLATSVDAERRKIAQADIDALDAAPAASASASSSASAAASIPVAGPHPTTINTNKPSPPPPQPKLKDLKNPFE
jgi:serine/threonine protein kinase